MKKLTKTTVAKLRKPTKAELAMAAKLFEADPNIRIMRKRQAAMTRWEAEFGRQCLSIDDLQNC
jgi:hypothetical protein